MQPISDSTDELFTQNSSDWQAAQTSPLEPPVPLLALDELLLLDELLPPLPAVLLPQSSMAAHELALATHALASSDSIAQASLQFGGTCPHCFSMAAQTSAHDGLPDELPPPEPSFESPPHAPMRAVRKQQPRTA
ncbi:Hypothetical protein A7982_06457 [Minicystis rosea]|nr:Hypothetical protein A7982_06457 [Minicystis rosea]